MSLPGIFRRLFGNEGAGPKLLPEIIPPHADTHGEQGSDPITPESIGALPASASGGAASADVAGKLKTTRSIDGMGFDGTKNIIHYAVCSTAAATAAKTVNLTGFVLEIGARILVRFDTTNTAVNPTLNVNGTGAKAIRYKNATVTASVLAAKSIREFVYDGAYWQIVGDLDSTATYGGATSSAPGTAGLVPGAAAGSANRYLSAWGLWTQGTTRKILTGTATLYVRLDGNNGNDGASNDAAHAFRTVNAALGYVAERLLPGNSSVVIQVADGVFQEMINVPRISSRGGRIVIRGSGKGTVLERNNGGCVYGAHGSYVELENLTVRSRRTEDVSYAAAGVSFGSGITLRNVAVEVVDDSLSETQLVPLYCYARNGMLALEDVSISLTGTNSRIFPAVVMQGGYAAFSGSMAVSGRGSAFIRCTNGGLVTCYGDSVSFSGSFSGKRYSLDTMSCIDTNGQGPDYLPGDQAGICDDNSAYL